MKQEKCALFTHQAARWLSLGLTLALCACLAQPLLAADATLPNVNSNTEAESTPSSVPATSLPAGTSTPNSEPAASLPASPLLLSETTPRFSG